MIYFIGDEIYFDGQRVAILMVEEGSLREKVKDAFAISLENELDKERENNKDLEDTIENLKEEAEKLEAKLSNLSTLIDDEFNPMMERIKQCLS